MTEKAEYQVLARTCRPQAFEQVLGQDHVTATLRNAIANNRIPHALILSGPRGVGKTSIARIMAKALNCEKGPTPDPCNTCNNCCEITAGSSLDVREIDGASNRGIDEIRELRENVNFSPAASPYKVYIIDEVHMLTREAFNALLKTLEEPPSHTIFIFATTEIHKVPATILSRCQSFDLRRISQRQIVSSLRNVSRDQGIEISDRALAWLAEAADGSLRDAQGLLDQAISFAGVRIADEKIEELLNITDRRFLLQLSEAVLNREPGRCLAILEEAYYAGLDMKYLYGMLLKHFRNCLLVKILGAEASLIELSPEELSQITALVARVSQEDIQRLLDILLREEEKVKKSYDPRISNEIILVKMALLPPAVPILEIIERLESIEKRLINPNDLSIESPVPAAAPEEKRKPDEERDDQNHLAKADNGLTTDPWERCKSLLKKTHPILFSKISSGIFMGLDRGSLRIGFPGNYIFLDDVKSQENLTAMVESASRFFPGCKNVRIETIATQQPENTTGSSNEASGANKMNALRREALNHPALLKIMDTFGAAEIREIIPRKNNQSTGGKSIDK